MSTKESIDNHRLEEPLGSKSRRRHSNQGTTSKEAKRARGAISCAECRRLKLKCDKQVPCSSCTRRGCVSICPNGFLTAGVGTRYILADTEKLHSKISEMGTHIRKLEDALRISHSCRSRNPHPLLSDDLLQIKKGIRTEEIAAARPTTIDDETFIELFGTLTITDRGTQRFLGASGTTESLLLTELAHCPNTAEPLPASTRRLPVQLSQASRNWIFTPRDNDKRDKLTLLQLIDRHLPNRQRASSLCEAYLENLSWFFQPIDRQQLVEELVPALYNTFRPALAEINEKNSREGDIAWSLNLSDVPMDMHDIALTFAAFACGAAADLTLPPYNDEAEMYRELALAALSMKSVLDSEGTSLSAVQCVAMLGAYLLFSGRSNSLEKSWKVQSFGCMLATSIGLHRDPLRWKLGPKQVQRRRRVFWEIYTIDHWKSLSCGRPISFPSSVIDCEYAHDIEATIDDNGNVVPSYWYWKHRFSYEVVSRITEKLCSSKPIKFMEVLELDRAVREFDDGYPVQSTAAQENSYRSVEPRDVAKSLAVRMYKDIALLYIHRSFFAEAIMKYPSDPLQSPFAQSFIAAYRSATKLLGFLREKFDALSHLLLRMWSFWAHALSAAVMVGSIVNRCPDSHLASSAFIELKLAIKLFEKATIHPVVRNGLPILLRLRDKAECSSQRSRSIGRRRSSVSPMSHSQSYVPKSGQLGSNSLLGKPSGVLVENEPVSEGEDEISILRGRTRLVSVHGLSEAMTETILPVSVSNEEEQSTYQIQKSSCAADNVEVQDTVDDDSAAVEFATKPDTVLMHPMYLPLVTGLGSTAQEAEQWRSLSRPRFDFVTEAREHAGVGPEKNIRKWLEAGLGESIFTAHHSVDASADSVASHQQYIDLPAGSRPQQYQTSSTELESDANCPYDTDGIGDSMLDVQFQNPDVFPADEASAAHAYLEPGEVWRSFVQDSGFTEIDNMEFYGCRRWDF